MAESLYTIRRGMNSDVGAIAALVNEIASLGHLLPRSIADVENTIDDWRVALIDDRLVGCGSLMPYSARLAEVRSLAVAQDARGMGLGGELLAALIDDAKARDFETLFALTRSVPFFERHGFREGRRVEFPEKIWQDCLACPLLLSCGEATVVLGLKSGGPIRRILRRASEKGLAHVH